jgi:hypothetical protein
MRTYLGMRQWIGMLAASAAFPVLAQEHFNFTTTTKYTGRAIALQVTEARAGGNPATVVVTDSGFAPITGGQVQDLSSDASPVPGVTAQELYSVTLGAGGQNLSQASMTHLDAQFGPHHVTALWVESKATAAAKSRNLITSGKSIIEGLTVDGQPTAVTGATNQTIVFPDGYLVINEQSGSSSPHFGSRTVNALHLVVGSSSLIAASSKAEVIYEPLPDSPP